MARMIPNIGPAHTQSDRAEPNVYWHLSKQLPDDFTVIHSLPWLSKAAREIDNRSVPTGEIDFLILNAKLGVLALEIKAGILGFDQYSFVRRKTNEREYPVNQVRRGTHGLAQWIACQGGPRLKIGYAVLLHDSVIGTQPLPPALVDPTVSSPQKIIFDMQDLSTLGRKIIEVMHYWKTSLSSGSLTQQQLDGLVDLICPIADYTPSWSNRIEFDGETWLRLTDEQAACLKRFTEKNRMVVTGGPGTGKTLLATTLTRGLVNNGKKILLLTYNALLAEYLRDELSDLPGATVLTFHKFCAQAERVTGRVVTQEMPSVKDGNWYKEGAIDALKEAIEHGKIHDYDALIVDESQALSGTSWELLTRWMAEKKIIAFCDESQVFEFEGDAVSTEQLSGIIGAEQVFNLTINLRSPRVVFEKLQNAFESNYQSHSPRPLEPDSLVELAFQDPDEELLETINSLKTEKIPEIAITIVYTGAEPPGEFTKEIRTVGIAKYRGLESPVVIVYVNGGASDPRLRSAYSRATTRCIVIYHPLTLTESGGGALGKELLDSHVGDRIKEAAAAYKTHNLICDIGLKLEKVTGNTAQIFWCHDWNGWAVYAKDNRDISTFMWMDHLCLTYGKPVYYWDLTDNGTVHRYQPLSSLREHRNSEILDLRWCNTCQTTTRHRSEFKMESQLICEDCEQNPEATVHPPDFSELKRFDQILHQSNSYSNDEKKALPINLIVLGRWLKLSDTDIARLLPLTELGGSVGNKAALLLVLTELLGKPIGYEVSLDALAQKFWGWSLYLQQQLHLDSWKKSFVSPAISILIQKKWLKKSATGIYQLLVNTKALT